MPGGAREVVVVGGGPVAGAALLALAGGGGPWAFVLVDAERVPAHEAVHHPLLRPEDAGSPRAERACRRLADLHPGVRVEALAELPAGLSGAGAVLACTGDPSLARLAGTAALEAGVPLVHAAWCAGAGHLLTVQPGLTPCLDCLFEGVGAAPQTAPDGLAFALAWSLGGLAAAELDRLLAGEGGLYAGRLLALGATGASRAINVRRRPGCQTCASVRRHDPPLPPPEST